LGGTRPWITVIDQRQRQDNEHYESVDEVDRDGSAIVDAFDRVAFAMRMLDVFRPEMTVVIYECNQALRIERGRDADRGGWALVGIPSHASKSVIVHELARLAGVDL
jgi:hypothetical protein